MPNEIKLPTFNQVEKLKNTNTVLKEEVPNKVVAPGENYSILFAAVQEDLFIPHSVISGGVRLTSTHDEWSIEFEDLYSNGTSLNAERQTKEFTNERGTGFNFEVNTGYGRLRLFNNGSSDMTIERFVVISKL